MFSLVNKVSSHRNEPRSSKLSAFLAAVLSGGEDGPLQLQGGMIAGSHEGKTDRKDGNINELNPYSSFKDNPPLIKLDVYKEDEIYFPYPGLGLPPK